MCICMILLGKIDSDWRANCLTYRNVTLLPCIGVMARMREEAVADDRRVVADGG